MPITYPNLTRAAGVAAAVAGAIFIGSRSTTHRWTAS